VSVRLVARATALLLFLGCSGGVTLPSTRDPAPADPAPASSENALESQMHELVNRRRTSRGLAPLQWHPRLAEIARGHSRAMAEGRRGFGHDGFDERGSAVGQILSIRAMAENVAYDSRTGPDLAERVLEGWIASSGHRRNIEGDFTVTGIGAARGSDGVRYFTQIFVKTGG
jgi:uncharacterized protein YkwD